MSQPSTRFHLEYIRLPLAGILVLAAMAIVVLTYRWPLVWDAQVLHYIRFLIDRGYAPYRDIADINMPGAYVLEGWAMHLFGESDLAWRVYDFTLLGLLTLAMIVIARPYDWVAGLFAGVMFSLIHTNNGPWNSVERDEVMTVLTMVGYAFLFEGMRRKKPWLLLGFGFTLGMAGTVKPTVAPLGVLLLAMAVWTLRKRREAVAAYISYAAAGAAIAGGIVLSFLVRYRAIRAFFEIASRLTPYYASLEGGSIWSMVRSALPKVEFVVLPFALAVALFGRNWKNWERWALLLGAAFGAFSYFIQRKGYEYHKYPFTAFALLWMAIELTLAMRNAGWMRTVGVAGLFAGTLYGVPTYLYRVHRLDPVSGFTNSLETDLSSIGRDRLEHQVQCMDLVQGCYTALYHLKLVQSSGLMGDLLLFAVNTSPVVDHYRDAYWNELASNPPSVIVVSNEWFGHLPSFDKLHQWPRFASYLQDNYQLVISKNFDTEAHHAYRIYVRKGVPLPIRRTAG